MRLDKLVATTLGRTRSQVRKLLQDGAITVNGAKATSGKKHVDPQQDVISAFGDELHYESKRYLMLNKPAGVISATTDPQQQTVLSLLPESARKGIFPVGRLDKDTTGLLLLTNDGHFAHQLMSPKKHVAKTYRALVAGTVTAQICSQFSAGLTLRTGEVTRPAQLTLLKGNVPTGKSSVQIVIVEGKYHQIKRMFGAVGMKVLQLQRCAIGQLQLDPQLKAGQVRALTPAELALFKQLNTLS
ncbi:pseudouridine synthase [Liquorilactobacillus satsumensis]|uniref:Pseudouridine synthase n=1 Tax=Liquorilactobacillus satsumensis DSM 16230 = JCM 12392 TaxID=1423801 RepID=A0A0R1V2V9_9LACO|nr:pseudouridine synthase [Liquorilactobacillus satsumensis]KRL97560.1 ribosomal small subunit pseudouridine synthase A [Liquorilactobacillus satsumensis DSM 16230 = JCM 12392]MCP9327514.1 rRNA pseudouridine synthase [Liquorilactobacillus satsumensis]